MRIAQIVAYVSKDGAFGGPVAVAVAQAQALASRGHEVDLLAAWDGEAELDVPGVRVHLFRAKRRKRLTTMIAPGLANHVRRHRREWDAIHIHFGRDLITLGAWSAARDRAQQVILQPHGMLPWSRRASVRLLDALVVRAALRRAKAVLALTPSEQATLARIAGAELETTLIRNGIVVPERVDLSRPPDAVVLFLARLHPRKNVMVFAEAARRLLQKGSALRFRVIGPDEGDLVGLRRFIDDNGLRDSLTYGGVVEPGGSARELSRAGVFVLPSTGEVYPMTVLEALAEGTPVVLSSDSGLSGSLQRADAARICAPAPGPLAEAIDEVTRSEDERRALAGRGHAFARAEYGIDAVAARLVAVYEAA